MGTKPTVPKAVEREILLAFWKVHILHHASEEPVVGQWLLKELHQHGYHISPGTLYPLLQRLEERGWLRSKVDPNGGPRARREYTITPDGETVLAFLRQQVEELYQEVVLHREAEPKPPATSPGSATGARRTKGSGR
jgi:DNA-binding PadR family transcriptional regulator